MSVCLSPYGDIFSWEGWTLLVKKGSSFCLSNNWLDLVVLIVFCKVFLLYSSLNFLQWQPSWYASEFRGKILYHSIFTIHASFTTKYWWQVTGTHDTRCDTWLLKFFESVLQSAHIKIFSLSHMVIGQPITLPYSPPPPPPPPPTWGGGGGWGVGGGGGGGVGGQVRG